MGVPMCNLLSTDLKILYMPSEQHLRLSRLRAFPITNYDMPLLHSIVGNAPWLCCTNRIAAQ